MKVEYLFFIVLSAFLHAFYNFLMRKSVGNRTFLSWMFIVATGVSVVFTLAVGGSYAIPWRYVPHVFAAGFFYACYQIMVSKAYERGNISRYYPLTMLSPVLIPIWAWLALSERISFLTGLGIGVTIVGAIMVKLDSYTWKELKKMFGFSQDYLTARIALGASVVYSFGSVLDKAKIAYFPLPVYHILLLGFVAVDSVWYSRVKERQKLMPYFFKYWKSILLAGFLLFFSFLTFRYSLRVVPVTVAVPVRQVAIVFAILLGVFSLKEKLRWTALIGSLVIILGVVLVNFGI